MLQRDLNSHWQETWFEKMDLGFLQFQMVETRALLQPATPVFG